MPPLRIEGVEPTSQHGLTQNHAVGKLLGSDAPTCRRLAVITGILTRLRIAAEVGMALRSEDEEVTIIYPGGTQPPIDDKTIVW